MITRGEAVLTPSHALALPISGATLLLHIKLCHPESQSNFFQMSAGTMHVYLRTLHKLGRRMEFRGGQNPRRGLVACQEEGEGLRGGLIVSHGAAAALVLAVDHEVEEGARLHSPCLLPCLSRRWRRPRLRRAFCSGGCTWHRESHGLRTAA